MELWKLAILFLSAFIGGLGVFLFKNDNKQRLKLLLSFSGAYLFAITVLHLIPEVYETGGERVGLFVLGGFLFQILLEQFSEGIEHGHVHKHSHQHYAFPFGIMISLCLHALLEGMPLAEGHQNELIFGISLHHIPAAFALGSALSQNNLKRGPIIISLAVFAAMSPLGYIFSNALSTGSFANLTNYFDSIMGLVIGIFLHISTTILFESSVDHHYNIRKMVAVLTGIAIALVSFWH
ncbi:MAG TPA: ZIP family metal transporter [Sphingobacteriaceae bacterium]